MGEGGIDTMTTMVRGVMGHTEVDHISPKAPVAAFP
jgi:hypothetical protein